MKVPRDVILDLLPLYLAGEASAATRQLVEESLREHPDLERLSREQTVTPREAPGPAPEVELRALLRARRLLGVQKWLFGLGIAFTSIALATEIGFDHGRLTRLRLLIFDHPAPFGISLALGIACWMGYAAIRRRLRTTAL
jgi:hypothetical protein